MKLVFIGLSRAGKTSIVKKFFLSYSVDELQYIRPTIFKEKTETHIQAIDEPIYVLDLGGQESYLAKHTDQNNFKDLDFLIYVVDIQDLTRMGKTKEYFVSILDTIKDLNIKPLISIMFHKYDPEKRQTLEENLVKYYLFVTEIFKDIKPIINLTSIFDNTSNIALSRLILKRSFPSVIKLGLEHLSTEILNIGHYTQNDDLLSYLSESGKTYGIAIRDTWLKQLLTEKSNNNPVTEKGNVKFDLETVNNRVTTVSINI